MCWRCARSGAKEFAKELASTVATVTAGLWRLLVIFGRLLYMTLRKKESLWVIAFRGQVEIRACTKPPRAHCDSVDRVITQSVREMFITEEGQTRFRNTKVPKKITLKNTIHVGGRVLKTMSANEYYNLTDSSPRAGTARKLTNAQALLVLGHRGRRDV